MKDIFGIDSNGSRALLSYIYHKIESLIDSYMQRHSKMFVIRGDIRYPENYKTASDNKHIQRCIAKTAQFLKRHGFDPAYVWVREQKQSKHPHYHCIFFLNGHKTQSAGLTFALLTRYWSSTIQSNAEGLIHYCKQLVEECEYQYGSMVHRAVDLPLHVYGMMTYLAKKDGKGEPKDGLRDFGMSRIPNQPPTSKD